MRTQIALAALVAFAAAQDESAETVDDAIAEANEAIDEALAEANEAIDEAVAEATETLDGDDLLPSLDELA